LRAAKELLMKWLLVLLGLGLIAAAGGGLIASIDLLTTEIGVLYATCAAIALAAGLIILSLAAIAFRIDALRAAILRQGEYARRAAEATLAPPVTVLAESPAPTEAAPVETASVEGENAPPLAADGAPMEQNPAEPTTLVGRYTAGGANYSIFSDGSIEAETDQGAFHFASMNEFKAYVAAKRA
jgi:hypothetical protein